MRAQRIASRRRSQLRDRFVLRRRRTSQSWESDGLFLSETFQWGIPSLCGRTLALGFKEVCLRGTVRTSIKEDCLDWLIPIGEQLFRRAVTEYVEHYHGERNHQGLENRPISGRPVIERTRRVRRRSRLGGLLNFYQRARIIIRSAATFRGHHRGETEASAQGRSCPS